MADISVLISPSGVTYNIKDATARQLIEEIDSFTAFMGVTTTALTEGATTNPIVINGESVTAQSGNIATYGSKEFIFNGTAWNEFGDLSGLGTLAFQNSASGAYTPAGTISTPTITVTPSTTTVNSITAVGTLPTLTTAVTNETLTLTWSAGTLPTKGSNTTVATGIQSATSSTPTFNGTSGTITVE